MIATTIMPTVTVRIPTGKTADSLSPVTTALIIE
jgi:hypothetical protein